MNGLHQDLLAAIVPKLSMLISNGTSMDTTLYSQSRVLQAWCDLLSFSRWLRLDGPIPLFGKRLVMKIVPETNAWSVATDVDPQLPDFCAGTLATLLEEFHLCSQPDRLAHLDVAVATYMSFCRIPGSNGECCSSFSAKSNL